MPLTAIEIKAFKAKEKSYRKSDEKGLYIEVFQNGSKLWRWKYRINGKEKRIALGAWPEVNLAKARDLRDSKRRMLVDGIDPALERKKSKAAKRVGAGNSFELLAKEYIEKKMIAEGRAESTIKKAYYFLGKLLPAIGQVAVTDINPQMLLVALQKIEKQGAHETAKKCRSFASRVFRYAIWTSRGEVDPSSVLQGALITPKAKHYAAILDPKKLGDLLCAIDVYDGHPTTKFALLIAPHVFVRPGELRHAEWQEFDFSSAIWSIPAGKMKARKPHAVPLSKQVLVYLHEIRALYGDEGFVFPAFHTSLRPMSENTVNTAFRRMGFSKEEITAHGLRATASTLLNESGEWSPDAIERALAHGDSNAVRGAYSRGSYWDERVKMNQWWSDYLDKLRMKNDG